MPRILIVEDNMEFRTLLETMVRLEGHEVFLAANGETGLAQARSRKPDIILSDIEMPGMDGITLIRELKASPELAHSYVILITGASGQSHKLDALRAGADDFLEKPSSRQEILGRIEIAQKVMAVQGQLREAEARAAELGEVPGKVIGEIASAEKIVVSMEEAISKKNVGALLGSMKDLREALARARAAADVKPAASGDSWL